jgi:hypothetical protein
VPEVAGEDQRQNDERDEQVTERLLAQGLHGDILAKDD